MSEPETMSEAVAQMRGSWEHVIFVVFTVSTMTGGGVAVPVCWCHHEQEASDVRDKLLADTRKRDAKPSFIWYLPVSDVPRMP